MKHIVFLLYVLTFAVGVSAITLSILFYIRERIRWFGYYIFFQLVVLFLLFMYALRIYDYISFFNVNDVAIKVIVTISFANIALLIYFIPFIVFHMIRRAWGARENLIFLAVDAAYIALVVLYLVFNYNIVFFSILNGIFFADVIFCIVICLLSLTNIKERAIKQAVRIFMILSAVFFPLILLNSFLDRLFGVQTLQFPFGMLLLPLYHLWWNMTLVIYLIYYLSKPRNRRVIQSFLRVHGITRREEDIVDLLIDGRTAKEISDLLTISPNTVNNHIASIYQKAKVKNRIELMNLLS
ncbi:MAG: helix-turn-helix transcriptional regulator [Spirochaetes bacterium]|nr:helix-turn-helix transcriptional regulator [Spirochaetota bacterium]